MALVHAVLWLQIEKEQVLNFPCFENEHEQCLFIFSFPLDVYRVIEFSVILPRNFVRCRQNFNITDNMNWSFLFGTGTTWTQETVWQVLNDGELSELFLDARSPYYEVGTWQPNIGKYTHQSEAQAGLDALPSPRLLKTHLPFHLMPLQISSGPITCKIIYVIRNPKDAAISLYHHVKSLAPYNYEAALDQFLPLYMAGKGKRMEISWNK